MQLLIEALKWKHQHHISQHLINQEYKVQIPCERLSEKARWKKEDMRSISDWLNFQVCVIALCTDKGGLPYMDVFKVQWDLYLGN